MEKNIIPPPSARDKNILKFKSAAGDKNILKSKSVGKIFLNRYREWANKQFSNSGPVSPEKDFWNCFASYSRFKVFRIILERQN